MAKLHALQEIRFSDLQSRLKGKVSMDRLLTFLSRCGQVCSTVMDNGLCVLKWINYAGRVCYGYGTSFRDALISVSYQAWCV